MSLLKQKSFFTCAPTTERGKPTQLEAHPDSNNFEFLYVNGRSVYKRNLFSFSEVYEYRGHTYNTTVARYSPNGNYIASGDSSGCMKVWSINGDDKAWKMETFPVNSNINDLAWDAESLRIIAVGQGTQRFGHVMSYDTGNTCGEIIGHSKEITCCDMRKTGRPFRAVTGSHDFTVKVYHGTPYRFEKEVKDHSNSVNAVRYSKDGNFFASVGNDRKIFLYDGLTAERKGDFNSDDNVHQGSIYALAWSEDSKQFATSSTDGTVKLWDIETQKCYKTYNIANEINIKDQQVGNLWKGDTIVSLSLDSTLNYMDSREASIQKRVHGHSKAVNKVLIPDNEDKENLTFFSGDSEGRVLNWDSLKGETYPIQNSNHQNMITGLIYSSDKEVISVGMDDYLKVINNLSYKENQVAIKSEPIDIIELNSNNLFLCATKDDKLKLLNQQNLLSNVDLKFTPTALAYNSKLDHILVGSTNKGAFIYQYNFTSNQLECLGSAINETLDISKLCYSPDGQYCTIGFGNGKVYLYDATNLPFKLITTRSSQHTSRVKAIAFSNDGSLFATSGVDSNIYVFLTKNPLKKVSFLSGHSAAILDLKFLKTIQSEDGKFTFELITSGQDGNIKVWEGVLIG